MPLVHFSSHAFDAKLIAFDKDGTLFDFAANWRPRFLNATERLLALFPHRVKIRGALYDALGFDAGAGVFVEHGPFATATGEAVIFAATTVLYQMSVPRRPWEDCEQLVRQEFAPLFVDVNDLISVMNLEWLFSSLHENGVALAVITNDDTAPTETALARASLSRYVDFIACGDGPHRPKPAPDALLAAAEAVGAPLDSAVVVGDSVTDLRMARAAGAGLCVAVLTGTGTRESLAAYADLILASIAEIRVGVIPADEPPPAPARSSCLPGER